MKCPAHFQNAAADKGTYTESKKNRAAPAADKNTESKRNRAAPVI